MEEKKVLKAIEELLTFAEQKLGLGTLDIIYARNALMEELQINESAEPVKKFTIPKEKMIEPIIQWAINKLNKFEDTPNNRILYEAKIFGMVMPSPSCVNAKFDSLARNKGLNEACEYLFEISKNSNYIRKIDIDKNIKWKYKDQLGDIDITINLSKPEKDPKEIEKAKLLPQTGYPKCPLCKENMGFPGNVLKAARQTLRIIPILLNDEQWYIQYSPYQYYDYHLIAFSEKHEPMDVTKKSISRLLDFVFQFPFYFIGSNAALPIVGGSILSHDHYQGGSKVLPMMSAHAKKIFESDKFPSVKFSIVDWYNSVVRMESSDKNQILEAADKVLKKWKKYTDEKVDIISETNGTPHNAITPIARYENNTYILDFILRNNRTTNDRPDGLFHPEKRLHNIKKEGIGIIEVMGLFILPGRLKEEFALIKDILTGKSKLNLESLQDINNPLNKHFNMIIEIVRETEKQIPLKETEAEQKIRDYVNKACKTILETTAVFKNDGEEGAGQTAFQKFMEVALELREKSLI